jgi:hypothetical protein
LVYSGEPVDLDQSLAAALFIGLPPWLRDHPSLPHPAGNCCNAQSENFQKNISICGVLAEVNVGGSDAEIFGNRAELVC